MIFSYQRLRNLTSGHLHTTADELEHDLMYLLRERGPLMPTQLHILVKALEPVLIQRLSDPRFWNGKYDPEHEGVVGVEPLDPEELRALWNRYRYIVGAPPIVGLNIVRQKEEPPVPPDFIAMPLHKPNRLVLGVASFLGKVRDGFKDSLSTAEDLRSLLSKAQEENEKLREENLKLERLCDATYVAQGADAYNHACSELEAWQAKRRKAKKAVGVTHSLVDGMGWLYERVQKLENEVDKNRSYRKFVEKMAASFVRWDGRSYFIPDTEIRRLQECEGETLAPTPAELMAAVNAYVEKRPEPAKAVPRKKPRKESPPIF